MGLFCSLVLSYSLKPTSPNALSEKLEGIPKVRCPSSVQYPISAAQVNVREEQVPWNPPGPLKM